MHGNDRGRRLFTAAVDAATQAGARPGDVEPLVHGWVPDFSAALRWLVDTGQATVCLEIVQELSASKAPGRRASSWAVSSKGLRPVRLG